MSLATTVAFREPTFNGPITISGTFAGVQWYGTFGACFTAIPWHVTYTYQATPFSFTLAFVPGEDCQTYRMGTDTDAIVAESALQFSAGFGRPEPPNGSITLVAPGLPPPGMTFSVPADNVCPANLYCNSGTPTDPSTTVIRWRAGQTYVFRASAP